jgi:probable H4MPT-linked C1 transfer pathway protein
MKTLRPLTILIHEWVTGGGLSGKPLPASWAVEGRAMRRAIASEFAATLTRSQVVVTLDEREPEDLGPWTEIRISPDGWPDQLLAQARIADYTVLIAPETRGALASLTRDLEAAGARTLGSDVDAIELAADKARLAELLRARGLPTLPGRIVNLAEGLPADAPYPAVLKPIDGAGAVDTFLIKGPEDLPETARLMRQALLQPFHEGVPMSGSFLVDQEGMPWLIGTGRQFIVVEHGRFAYRGGMLPVPCRAAGPTLMEGIRAVHGLAGPVGIDFLWNESRQKATILEINPRPTTSVAGWCQVLPAGMLARAWLAACAVPGHDPEALISLTRVVEHCPVRRFDAGGGLRDLAKTLKAMSKHSCDQDARVPWLALDVGGANLKAAHSDGTTRTIPFEVWRRPAQLGAALRTLVDQFPAFDRMAATMTAELCDCFSSRAEGVLAVLDALETTARGRPVDIWGVDGCFHDVMEIRNEPIRAAAANWLALATVSAFMVPQHPAILIDVGSTTSDLIPLDRGRVAARGRTDLERLETGELVYAGVRRTPLCALATELTFRDGRPIGLAAEWFATTLDVFVTLGDLPPDEADSSTADGRPASVECARGRLARMVGEDRDGFGPEDARTLAQSARNNLMNRLELSAAHVCATTVGMPTAAVVAGSGEFLAERLARRLLGAGGHVIRLSEAWGESASTAACARALIELTACGRFVKR